ncbi:TraY domain-containing protein [uncultured Hydrogenophaga sp.]|uniref:TraY domain-containing protein n=1 Tax=uncultured Hydrogenophaga sp. TaxID=199683 RepID=UPI0025835F29|nr:TraY domain-containing protein [uncultured Hydrogenophaga sp.]
MAVEDVQTNLRIPGDLKERLQASADAAGRSLSAEAAYRLAASYEMEVVAEELRRTLAAQHMHSQAAKKQVEHLTERLNGSEREQAKMEERIAHHVAKIQQLERQLARGGEDLVLDQAAQIWDLRRKIAVAHLELVKAAEVLRVAAPSEKAAYEEAREALKRTAPETQLVVDELARHLAGQQVDGGGTPGADVESQHRPPQRRIRLPKPPKK